MNILQLEYLKELYTFRSFSRAAEKLGLTQPALTLQIQKLEEELDFKILDRSKRPFSFTPEGQLFYEKSIDILYQLEQLKQISVELSEEVRGNLKVGVIPTLAPYLVPLFILQLNKEFPELQIEIWEKKTEAIISEIKSGNLDCGLISTPVSAKNIQISPLFYERFYIYVSELHPLFERDKLTIQEIDGDDIWYLSEGNCFQNQVNSICKINLQKEMRNNLIYHSDSIESLRRIVENKNGITFIPELATINISSEQEELIKEFDEEQPIREISLITHKQFTKERQIDTLKRIICENIPKRMLTKPESSVIDTML